MRLVKENPILATVYSSFYNYPTPSNLTYFWNFGIYSMLCLGVQIVTGIGLAMHYVPDIGHAFLSVEHIMRDVNYGWLLRYIHANGASMFFIVVYIHIFRGLYYGSYIRPRQLLWSVGVIIFLLMVIIAFMGYVLPWGQMSFWGATVITNLFSAVPVIGNDIVIWLWGGYSVGNPTLTRFFSLHFFLPFILLALVGIHLIYLHRDGSNNPLGIDFKPYDAISMYPYYILKDLFGVFIFVFIFGIFVFFYPNLLGHSDNYIPANPLITPSHIVPEWYLLPFYAILRSIPDKLLGVLALAGAILILLVVPVVMHSEIRSYAFKPISQVLFWIFLVSTILLGWIGASPVKYPFVIIGQFLTIFYFSYFVVLAPFILQLEKQLWLKRDLYIIGLEW
jgi:quinol-cytochrome oxidoreductase complex cytochrome b subunit